MKRTNTQKIGEAFREFFQENPVLYQRMMEIRIRRAWSEVLGNTIMTYTKNVYVKDGVLHVTLTSSVLRNELMFSRDRLVKSLNDYAGSSVIRDIIFR